jgi:hypothetical protein
MANGSCKYRLAPEFLSQKGEGGSSPDGTRLEGRVASLCAGPTQPIDEPASVPDDAGTHESFNSLQALYVLDYTLGLLGVGRTSTSVGGSSKYSFIFLLHSVVGGYFPPLPWLATCSGCVV